MVCLAGGGSPSSSAFFLVCFSFLLDTTAGALKIYQTGAQPLKYEMNHVERQAVYGAPEDQFKARRVGRRADGSSAGASTGRRLRVHRRAWSYQIDTWKHAQRLILVVVDQPDPKTGQ